MGLCIFPKESLKWNGSKMKSGTGEGVPDTCKAMEKFKSKSSNNILFWRRFTLTLTRDLGFRFLVVALCLVSQIAL